MQEVQEEEFIDSPFDLTIEDLGEICNFDKRTDKALVDSLSEVYGGVQGLAERLKTNLEEGLPLRYPNQMNSHAKGNSKGPDMTVLDGSERCDIFGENIIPPPRSETILEIVWGTIVDDPILKILIVGAVIVLSLGSALCPSSGWIEGMAIVVAVFIVLSVTAGNDWSKDRKFKKLMLLQSDKKVRVIRGGIKNEISSWDILVGDVVELICGDEVPADGVYVTGNRLIIDESPLTGETFPVKKDFNAPFLFSGCQVSEGAGLMLVTAVGIQSSGGKIQELLNAAQDQMTPLQEKLKDVAILIGKVGVCAGVLTFVVLAIRWGVAWGQGVAPHSTSHCAGGSSSSDTSILNRIIAIVEDFVISITVVVVAVPEGLPLAVTLALSISMFKMMRDNCFVRHLDASETMGQATTVCTDKTGTLTYNRMSAVRIMVYDKVYKGEGSGDRDAMPFTPKTFSNPLKAILTDGVCVNSTCFIKNDDMLDGTGVLPIFAGSATEGALLILARKLGIKYKAVRQRIKAIDNGIWSFTAERKRMSTMIKTDEGYRLYCKGASEIILALCSHILNDETMVASPMPENDRAQIEKNIKAWASEGLRTFALAYKDSDEPASTEVEGDVENNLVFIALIGIKDPLRKEIPGAVTMCQKAGLVIRMVTGDNILTATKIAKECNIFHGDGIAIEGPAFRAMNEQEKLNILPRLQVIARCSPADKFELVSLLKSQGEVVAVTGDGTNDAPALKEADIGFAMGISGTQIAMNASDIVLLDDNFASIVQATRWGRNVLVVIRKFLQFQLGINLVAVMITFLGAVVFGSSPLSTVQLLWINLIMDSFGAIALASDDPDPGILDQPPQRKTDPLLSFDMKQYILIQTIYQGFVLLLLVTSADRIWPIDLEFHKGDDATYGSPSRRAETLVFNVFILMQLTNLVGARNLDGNNLNIFQGFFTNRYFLSVLIIIAGVQVFAVSVAYKLFDSVPLSPQEWGICAMFMFINLPVIFLSRTLLKFINIALTKKSGKVGEIPTKSSIAKEEHDIVDVSAVKPKAGLPKIKEVPKIKSGSFSSIE